MTEPSPSVTAESSLPDWITPELIARTIAVWQPYYATELTPADAAAMILDVGRMFAVCQRER